MSAKPPSGSAAYQDDLDGTPDPISRYARRLANLVGGIYGRLLRRNADNLDEEAAKQPLVRQRHGPCTFTTWYLAARQKTLDCCRTVVRRFG